MRFTSDLSVTHFIHTVTLMGHFKIYRFHSGFIYRIAPWHISTVGVGEPFGTSQKNVSFPFLVVDRFHQIYGLLDRNFGRLIVGCSITLFRG